jgi:hypothetical protein
MEFTRLAVLYVHLIACCVAIGLVLTHDLAVVRQLLRGQGAAHADPKELASLQTTVSRALAVLWVTGVAIIALDVSVKGWRAAAPDRAADDAEGGLAAEVEF